MLTSTDAPQPALSNREVPQVVRSRFLASQDDPRFGTADSAGSYPRASTDSFAASHSASSLTVSLQDHMHGEGDSAVNDPRSTTGAGGARITPPPPSRQMVPLLPALGSAATSAMIELVGTAFLTFVFPLSMHQRAELSPIAISSMLFAIRVALGYVSGGHFNPAISFALWLCSAEGSGAGTTTTADHDDDNANEQEHAERSHRSDSRPHEEEDSADSLPAPCRSHLSCNFPSQQMISFVAAQVFGAFFAALYAFLLFGPSMSVPSIASSGEIGILVMIRGIVTEALFTFLLCSIQLHMAVHQRQKKMDQNLQQSLSPSVRRDGAREKDIAGENALNFSALALSCAWMASQWCGLGTSGGICNPALSTALTMTKCACGLSWEACGPMLTLWCYWAGEMLGSLGSAIAYVGLLNVVDRRSMEDH